MQELLLEEAERWRSRSALDVVHDPLGVGIIGEIEDEDEDVENTVQAVESTATQSTTFAVNGLADADGFFADDQFSSHADRCRHKYGSLSGPISPLSAQRMYEFDWFHMIARACLSEQVHRSARATKVMTDFVPQHILPNNVSTTKRAIWRWISGTLQVRPTVKRTCLQTEVTLL